MHNALALPAGAAPPLTHTPMPPLRALFLLTAGLTLLASPATAPADNATGHHNATDDHGSSTLHNATDDAHGDAAGTEHGTGTTEHGTETTEHGTDGTGTSRHSADAGGHGADAGGHAAAPEETPGAVTAQMQLNKDIADIPEHSAERTAFETAFKTDVAALLSIGAERVHITSIASGSIVVGFAVLPDSHGVALAQHSLTDHLVVAATVAGASVTAAPSGMETVPTPPAPHKYHKPHLPHYVFGNTTINYTSALAAMPSLRLSAFLSPPKVPTRPNLTAAAAAAAAAAGPAAASARSGGVHDAGAHCDHHLGEPPAACVPFHAWVLILCDCNRCRCRCRCQQLEKLMEFLKEKSESSKHMAGILAVVYKELTILGCLSFFLTMINEVLREEDGGQMIEPDIIVAFELAHLLIFLVAIVYMCNAIVCFVTLRHSKKAWNQTWLGMTVEEVSTPPPLSTFSRLHPDSRILGVTARSPLTTTITKCSSSSSG